MDDDLSDRLNAVSADLHRRAAELDQSGRERDTALMMQGLVVVIEAIRVLGAAGLSGLGKSGD